MYLMQYLISFNFYNKILFWESNVLHMFTCVFLLTYIVLTWVHMYVYIYIYICSIYVYIYVNIIYIIYIILYIIYICVYICINDHKWSTANRVLKSHKSKMSVICMKSSKQCVLPVITTMPLWELVHLGMSTSCTKCMSCHKVIVVITARARYLHDCIYIIYIYTYIYIYIIYIYIYIKGYI